VGLHLGAVRELLALLELDREVLRVVDRDRLGHVVLRRALGVVVDQTAKISSRILPPPTSLVLVGISGFSGSEPFVLMMAVLSPPPDALGEPLPLPEQPARASPPATSSAMPARAILLRFNLSSCAQG
jgi:hypothetical protein